jgi:hypothetical protein
MLVGFVGGALAGEIRKHVIASLQEAEARRQMERIQQDLVTARTIQQGLLPGQPLVTGGFDIAGWNRPADATLSERATGHATPGYQGKEGTTLAACWTAARTSTESRGSHKPGHIAPHEFDFSSRFQRYPNFYAGPSTGSRLEGHRPR